MGSRKHVMRWSPLGIPRSVEKIFLCLLGEERKINYPGKSKLIFVIFVFSQIRFVITVFFFSFFVGNSWPGGSAHFFLWKNFFDKGGKKLFGQLKYVFLRNK